MERYLLDASQIAIIRARCPELSHTLDEQDQSNHHPDKADIVGIARDEYCSDDIEIDDDAVSLSPSDDGCWVAAWLWVYRDM